MKEKFKIRSIVKEDHAAIIELIKNCSPYVESHHEYLYWILENYYKSTCFVCKNEENIIGYISGLPSFDENAIFIWQICVHQNYRKNKIGNMLLNHITERLSDYKLNSLQFTIDKDNIPSYRLFENFAIENGLHIEAVSDEKVCGSNEIAYKIHK